MTTNTITYTPGSQTPMSALFLNLVSPTAIPKWIPINVVVYEPDDYA